jgi:hypothetical protein
MSNRIGRLNVHVLIFFTVAELLREDRPGGALPGHIMEIIFQLHALREAMRQVRRAPSWP